MLSVSVTKPPDRTLSIGRRLAEVGLEKLHHYTFGVPSQANSEQPISSVTRARWCRGVATARVITAGLIL